MPIYNKYKLTLTDPITHETSQRIFDSRTDICKALNVSSALLCKLIDNNYDGVRKPHLTKEYVSVERMPVERMYKNPELKKQSLAETKQKKLQEDIAKIKQSMTVSSQQSTVL